MDTEKLKWVGPDGHTSPVCGDLVKGRTYAIPSEHVEYFLTQTGFWERPQAPAVAKKGKG